jgi:zinc protease
MVPTPPRPGAAAVHGRALRRVIVCIVVAAAAMPVTRRRLLLAAPAAVFALPSLAAPPGVRAAPLRVPPLALQSWRLPNGLQVFALPDAAAATVAVQVWYRVGAKDDPPGRSGFAHLFEHLMFKGTRHMPAETIDRLTEDVGGQNNAFTVDDVTVYHSEVPAHHLEPLLWAEAERMAHLEVDQASLDSERNVVIEEYRERVLADPYGRFFEALPAFAFDAHPYRRGVIGSVEDLRAATLADVRAFHRTYYRPDNAALVVAGGFDAAELARWVQRHFGPIAAPGTPIPRVAVAEPPRRRDEARRLRAPHVPLPAVALVWRGPAAAHRDAAALQVAASLLAGGDSSRLHEAMVSGRRLARTAGFTADLRADAGTLVGWAIAAGGVEPARLLAALAAETARLAEQPPSAAELAKVRTQLTTAALVERETPAGRAEALGWALALRGDPQAADRALDELQAVTAADVRRVVREHLLRVRRVAVTYVQGASA